MSLQLPPKQTEKGVAVRYKPPKGRGFYGARLFNGFVEYKAKQCTQHHSGT